MHLIEDISIYWDEERDGGKYLDFEYLAAYRISK